MWYVEVLPIITIVYERGLELMQTTAKKHGLLFVFISDNRQFVEVAQDYAKMCHLHVIVSSKIQGCCYIILKRLLQKRNLFNLSNVPYSDLVSLRFFVIRLKEQRCNVICYVVNNISFSMKGQLTN